MSLCFLTAPNLPKSNLNYDTRNWKHHIHRPDWLGAAGHHIQSCSAPGSLFIQPEMGIFGMGELRVTVHSHAIFIDYGALAIIMHVSYPVNCLSQDLRLLNQVRHSDFLVVRFVFISIAFLFFIFHLPGASWALMGSTKAWVVPPGLCGSQWDRTLTSLWKIVNKIGEES